MISPPGYAGEITDKADKEATSAASPGLSLKVRVCICAFVFLCMCVRVCVFVWYIYACVCVCVCICVCMYALHVSIHASDVSHSTRIAA